MLTTYLGKRATNIALALALTTPACAPRSTGPSSAPAPGALAEPREIVVLVHGMGRTRLSMMPLEWALEREGFEVLNWNYSSTCCTIAEPGDQLNERLRETSVAEGREVHFVGHSLGNIVIRWALANEPPVAVGRVVMLAPPNRGSEAADRYSPWLGWILKPLPELTTAEGSTARRLLLPPGVEVGIIAGRYDGKVSAAEARLVGQRAHAMVPTGHSFLMLRQDVLRLVLTFLREGGFDGVEGVVPGQSQRIDQWRHVDLTDTT